jgi:hypothetical protein
MQKIKIQKGKKNMKLVLQWSYFEFEYSLRKGLIL